jgi:hypothetical protein
MRLFEICLYISTNIVLYKIRILGRFDLVKLEKEQGYFVLIAADVLSFSFSSQ